MEAGEYALNVVKRRIAYLILPDKQINQLLLLIYYYDIHCIGSYIKRYIKLYKGTLSYILPDGIIFFIIMICML